jgi:hypothetical protein
MKLLSELLTIREEAIAVMQPEDVWADNKDGVITYITSTIYFVKQIEDSDPKKWEVLKDVDGTRKKVGTFDTAELEDLYVPVRANQKPDAEGYILHRDNLEVQAVRYGADTVKLDGLKKLRAGDYLIRREGGDDFIYSVQDPKYFEQDYIEKK